MNDPNKSDNPDQFWIHDPKVMYKDNNFLKFIPSSTMSRPEQLNALTRFAIYFLILSACTGQSILWIQLPIIMIFFLVVLYFAFKSDKEGMVNDLYRYKGIDVNAMGDEEYDEMGVDDMCMDRSCTDRSREDESKDVDDIVIESGYYDSDNKLRVGKYLGAHQRKRKPLKISLDDYTAYEKQACRMPTKDNPFMNPSQDDITIDMGVQPVACNVDDEQIQDKITDCYNEDLYRNVTDLFEKQNSQRQFYTIPQSLPNDQASFADWCFKNDNICKLDQSKCLRYEDVRYERGVPKTT